MSKICNINFWIGNDPPAPFGTFPKIHPFWRRHPSLIPVYETYVQICQQRDNGRDLGWVNIVTVTECQP